MDFDGDGDNDGWQIVLYPSNYCLDSSRN